MSEDRSLTQDEARERAALLEVDRYDLELDLTGLADGDALRVTTTIAFSAATAGGTTFVDCLADVEEATLNGRPLATGTPAARTPRAPRPRARQRAGGAFRPAPHRCRSGHPPLGGPERRRGLRVDELRAGRRPRGLSPASTSPTSRPSSASASTHRTVVGHEQHGRRRRSPRRRRAPVDLRGHASVVDLRPGRQRRALRRAAQHARRLRPRPVRAAVARADAGARRRGALRPHREGAGLLRRAVRDGRSRSRATTRSSCPSSAAPWRTTAASPGATPSSSATRPRTPTARSEPWSCCTRWRTCGSATW